MPVALQETHLHEAGRVRQPCKFSPPLQQHFPVNYMSRLSLKHPPL